MTGAALCELQSAEFVASTAFHLVNLAVQALHLKNLKVQITLTLSLSVTRTLSLSHSLSLTLSLTLTHTHTHTHSLSNSPSLSHSHSHTHTYRNAYGCECGAIRRPRFQVTKKRVRARHLQSLQHQAHVQSSPALYCSTTKCRNNALDSFGHT